MFDTQIYQLIMGLQLIMVYFKQTLIFLISLLIVQTLGEFEVGWGLYRWVDNHHSSFEAVGERKIVLSHPLYEGLSLEIQTDTTINQQFNNYNLSLYSVESSGQIVVQSFGKEIQIEFRDISNFRVDVKCTQQQCNNESNKIKKQLQQNRQFHDLCKSSQNHYQCTPNKKTIFIYLSLYSSKRNIIKSNLVTEKKNHKWNIMNFMLKHSITQSEIKTKIVESAINSLLNSICLYKFEGQYHLGFCEVVNNKEKKEWVYNIRLAAYSIALLGDYYYGLAEVVYKDYLNLIETKLLYPTEETTEVLPLPEHVQIFTKFGTIMQQQRESQLLNSFIVIPMMNQLGTLHEQLNYREAKKLHPLLLKMMSQKWSSSSQFKAFKSIYEEAFTQDFKYHSYGQKMEQSIGKNAWIYKVINLFTGTLLKHHLHYMPMEEIKEYLNEHFSLRKLFELYTSDDNNAKIGKYSNVIDAGEDLKLYSQNYGYDSLLVYVYGLGSEFPAATLKELQTPIGIKSSNQKKYQKNYRYRGDIHTYFNMKIISGLSFQMQNNITMQATKKKEINESLNKMGQGIANKIVEDFKKNQVIYTSWSPDGKGKEKCSWGQIVSILFLKWI